MRLKDLVKQVGGSTTNLFNLPVEFLHLNPHNIRLDGPALRDHVRAIADDIIANGYDRTQPLTFRVVDDRARVEDGNCRLMAVRLAVSEGAPILSLPCIPEPDGTDDIARLARMATRNTHLAHTAAEYAIIIRKLESYGLSHTDIALRLHKSRQWLSNILDGDAAPEEVKAFVATGAVSATEAVSLVRQYGNSAGAVIARTIQETGKERISAKHIRKVVESKSPKPADEPISESPKSITLDASPARPTPTVPSFHAPSRGDLADAVRTFLDAWADAGGEASIAVIEAVNALREMV